MVRTRGNILKLVEQHREALRHRGVRRLGLFGSAARDEATDQSDLDFVVQLQDKTFDTYMDVKIYLEDLFGCPVDLVLADTIKPRLRATILEEAIHAPGL